MDDLSRVVNFLALCREDAGNDGNVNLDFRGPLGLDFEPVAVFTKAGAADELDIELIVSAVF